MKTPAIFLFILFLFLFSQRLSAQNSETDSTTSHLLIEKGIALYDDGKYDEALKIYNSVSKCDPNYWWACYETALTYYDQHKLEIALSKCRESEDLNPENSSTLSLTGSILDDMGKTSEAIEYLNTALATRPYNQNLLFNLASCYANAHQYEKAEALLIRSIRVNPYHKSSNLLLAKVNFYMGRVAQSYLAYNMAVLLYPQVSYITQFENAISGKLDSLSHPYNYPYPAGIDHRKWDEISWLLKSEMAFNEDFDYDYKINYLTTRQSLMLFRKLTFSPSDTSIYSQFYARFFTGMMDKNFFEPYLYYSFKNTGNKAVNEWMKDNETRVNEFIEWAQKNINSWRSYGFSTFNEDKKEQTWHYNDDGDLVAIGKLKTMPEDSRYGEWISINNFGWIEDRGIYIDNKPEGEWFIYWPNGKVKQHLFYHDGKLDGINITYYNNGLKSGIYPFIKGKKDGLQQDLTPSGSFTTSAPYHDGKLDGKNIDYYYNDGSMLETPYVAGKATGKITGKWLNGNLKSELTAKDSVPDGPYRTWYSNAQPESEGSYKQGTETGKSIDYYPNGAKKTDAEFDEKGEHTGKEITYFRNGNIRSEQATLTNGLLTGTLVNYFPNGGVKSKLTYNENIPESIECFDASGKSIYTARQANGVLRNRTYYPDGILEMEGNLKDGKREGKWLVYDPMGRIVQELMYSNKFQSGKQKVFHENGILKEEFSCDSDLMVGLYKEYYSSGKLMTIGSFSKKGRNGEWVSFFPNDSVQMKSFYMDGMPAGRRFMYSPTGKMISEEFFNDAGKSFRYRQYDQSGKLEQDWKYEFDSVMLYSYYPSGKIKIKQLMVNNARHGTVEVYYPNGQLMSQIPYVYGLINGVSKKWDYNGNLQFEIPYVLGACNGLVKSYDNGKPWYTYEYEYDQSQGVNTEFYSNGKLANRIAFIDDKKDGNADFFAPDSSFMYRLIYCENVLKAYTYKDAAGKLLPEKPITPETTEIACYYPNGNVSARMSLKNGLFDGETKTYFPNGKVMREKMFSKGDFEGIYKYYFENGKLKELITFHNDEKEGQYQLFFENGKLYKTGQYLAGQAQGEWKVYNTAGNLVNTLYYDNDEIYEIK